jgi:hypothetical protein
VVKDSSSPWNAAVQYDEINSAPGKAAKNMKWGPRIFWNKGQRSREGGKRHETQAMRFSKKRRAKHITRGPRDFQEVQRHHSSLPGFLFISPAKTPISMTWALFFLELMAQKKGRQKSFRGPWIILEKRRAPHDGPHFRFWGFLDFSLHEWKNWWFEDVFVEEKRAGQTWKQKNVILEKEEGRTHGFEPIFFWEE